MRQSVKAQINCSVNLGRTVRIPDLSSLSVVGYELSRQVTLECCKRFQTHFTDITTLSYHNFDNIHQIQKTVQYFLPSMDILSPNYYMVPSSYTRNHNRKNTVLCISVAHMSHNCVKNIRTHVFHVISSIVTAQLVCTMYMLEDDDKQIEHTKLVAATKIRASKPLHKLRSFGDFFQAAQHTRSESDLSRFLSVMCISDV